MYNYDFTKETIKEEYIDKLVSINDKEILVNIIITDKNLLFFYNYDNDFVTKKAQGILLTTNYELIFQEELNSLNYVCDEDNTYINNDEVIIYDFILRGN